MMKKSVRPLSLIFVQLFVWTIVCADIAYAFSPSDSGIIPSYHHLRPKSSRDGDAKTLQADLTAPGMAAQGSAGVSHENFVPNLNDLAAGDGGTKGIEISEAIERPFAAKHDIFFSREGRFAEGRALILDLSEVDFVLGYDEITRARDYYHSPKTAGLPLRRWVEVRPGEKPIAAINGLQADLHAENGFMIADGALIRKGDGARGVTEERYTPLNGNFSVFVLDGRPRVQKVTIRDNALLTKGIQFALSGPPLLVGGEDVSQLMQERDVAGDRPAQGDEVAWDPKTVTSAFSAIGVRADGKIVLLSMRGDPEKQDEPFVQDVAALLKELGVKDAILLGGSADTQQYLIEDPEPFLTAKPRKGSMTQGERLLGTALLVYPKSGERSRLSALKIESNASASDGGRREISARLWQSIYSEAETLHQFLGSKDWQQFDNRDSDEVIRQFEVLETVARSWNIALEKPDRLAAYLKWNEETLSGAVQENLLALSRHPKNDAWNREEKEKVGEILRLLRYILRDLHHADRVAPKPITSALVVAERRTAVELLPRLHAFAGAMASDGGGRTLGEVFDAKTAQNAFDLRNPMDLAAVRKRGLAAIVLAGGEGTRMRPHLKQTFPFRGKPMGIWPILALREEGIPTVVVVGHRKEEVIKAFGQEAPGLTYIEQNPPLNGTADAVLYGLEALRGYDGPVLIINGDAAAMDADFVRKMEEALRETQRESIVVGYEMQDPKGYGRVVQSEDGEIVAIIEQSEINRGDRAIRGKIHGAEELDAIGLVNAGFYGFKNAAHLAEALRGLPPFRTQPNVEFGLPGPIEAGLSGELVRLPEEEEYKLEQPNDPDAVRALEGKVSTLRAAQDGAYRRFSRKFHEARRLWNLARTLHNQNVRIKGGVPLRAALLLGTVYIGPDVDVSGFRDGIIDVGTRVTGKSKISAKSHLSGHIKDSVIGEDVIIQPGVEIGNSIIGKGSRLQRGSHVTYCIVGERVKIADSTVEGEAEKRSMVGEGSFFERAVVKRYHIGTNTRIINATLKAEGESSFGNGVEIRIGPEKAGKRDLLSYDGLTLQEATDVVMQRDNRSLLETYREKVRRHTASVRSDFGSVGSETTIENTPLIQNAKIGGYVRIQGALEVSDSTLLGSPERPTLINSGAIIKKAVVKEGVHIGERATVEESVLLELSGASDDVKVEHSVIGPHSTMHFGHVVSSLIGPFVGKNHPSILIAVLWPEGRGNIGGQHTGSNHNTRGPDQEAFYPKLAFFGTNTDVFYPFSAATGLIVGGNLAVPSQKITLPFSVMTTPSVVYNPRLNEIVPGGVLSMTPYYLARAEYNHERLNREKGTDFDTRIFTPGVVDEMIRARALLDGKPASGKPGRKKAIYTEEDYPGIGKNILTEESRQRAVEVYDFYIAFYALKGLKQQLEVLKGSAKDWETLQAMLMVEDAAPEWKHARAILESQFSNEAGGWSPSYLVRLLEQLQQFEQRYNADILESKKKDQARGIGIFEVYDEVHDPIETLPVVVALGERLETTTREIGVLKTWLGALPNTEEKAEAAQDGARKGDSPEKLLAQHRKRTGILDRWIRTVEMMELNDDIGGLAKILRDTQLGSSKLQDEGQRLQVRTKALVALVRKMVRRPQVVSQLQGALHQFENSLHSSDVHLYRRIIGAFLTWNTEEGMRVFTETMARNIRLNTQAIWNVIERDIRWLVEDSERKDRIISLAWGALQERKHLQRKEYSGERAAEIDVLYDLLDRLGGDEDTYKIEEIKTLAGRGGPDSFAFLGEALRNSGESFEVRMTARHYLKQAAMRMDPWAFAQLRECLSITDNPYLLGRIIGAFLAMGNPEDIDVFVDAMTRHNAEAKVWEGVQAEISEIREHSEGEKIELLGSLLLVKAGGHSGVRKEVIEKVRRELSRLLTGGDKHRARDGGRRQIPPLLDMQFPGVGPVTPSLPHKVLLESGV
ncbi:MAG: DUF4954 family protein [Candidatus Omnitrophota bacterium]